MNTCFNSTFTTDLFKYLNGFGNYFLKIVTKNYHIFPHLTHLLSILSVFFEIGYHCSLNKKSIYLYRDLHVLSLLCYLD